jgi:hypothetical protein
MRVGLAKSLLSRRLAWALAWIALVVLVAVGINLVGIRLVGDVDGWTRWLDERAGYFLAWRLCLYGATAYGWIWMRRRLRERVPSAETGLRRGEIGAVATIALLEVSLLWRSP